MLASQTTREERVLGMRFGIGVKSDRMLEEAGQQFPVTRKRTRPIEEGVEEAEAFGSIAQHAVGPRSTGTSPMRAGQRLGWAGPAAAALFAASLIGFAAVRTDGYAHATKAVSELGAVDAPNALGFNLLGFVLPGLLVVALALGLRAALRSSAGPWLLAVSGLFFLGAGVFPVDMAARSSALSMAHLAAAQLSALAFAIAIFPLGSAMRRHPHFAALGRATPWFLLFLLANVAWQIVWQATGSILPGWGQRIAFGGYFAWMALAGYRLTRLSRA